MFLGKNDCLISHCSDVLTEANFPLQQAGLEESLKLI